MSKVETTKDRILGRGDVRWIYGALLKHNAKLLLVGGDKCIIWRNYPTPIIHRLSEGLLGSSTFYYLYHFGIFV